MEVFESDGGWSLKNFIKDHGAEELDEFRRHCFSLNSQSNKLLNQEAIFKDTNLVIVHKWNTPELNTEIGKIKKKSLHFVVI